MGTTIPLAHSRLLQSSDATHAAARDYLARQSQHFAACQVAVDTKAVEGRAAGTILEEAQREPGIMVVMTMHGRSGVSQVVLGSTAQDVLVHAAVPVLLVRAA